MAPAQRDAGQVPRRRSQRQGQRHRDRGTAPRARRAEAREAAMTDLAKALLRSKRGQDSPSPTPAPAAGGSSSGSGGSSDYPELECHFTPSSLRLTYNNQFGDGKPFSHARETVAKLDVELVFDNSDIGYSVMDELGRLAAMTGSSGASAAPSGQVPVVEFQWGGKLFEGVVESMTQTIEYWTLEGIPLRATVQLSLKETASVAYDAYLHTTDPTPTPPAVTPTNPPPASDKPATDTATRAGNPAAGRS